MKTLISGIRLWDEPYAYGIRAAIFQYHGPNQMLAKPVVFEKMKDAPYLIEPTFSMTRDDAQGLFNELWRMGYRPNDGTGNSGHVEALKYHLEDMRKLVFSDSKDGGPDAK